MDETLDDPVRIPIRAPGLSGSINPVGARVDDLTLNAHRLTDTKDSGPALPARS